MEGGDGHAILLDVNAVLEGVGSTNLANGVLRGHLYRIVSSRQAGRRWRIY